MKELKCYNLETISGTPEYVQLKISSSKHKKSAVLRAILYSIIAIILGYFLLMLGLISLTLTIASFSKSWLDLTNIIFMLVSVLLDLLTAAIFVPTFVMVVGFFNSLKTILIKNHNVAAKIVIGENYEEIEKLTTSGIFGLFYKKFINSLRKTSGRAVMDKIDQVEKEYKKGGVVLITPYSKFPLINGQFQVKLQEVSNYLVISIMFQDQASGIAITDLENKELIQNLIVST
jgi:hypothetical protein